MDYEELIRSIDFGSREFSLLLVDPKEKFIAWLRDYVKQKGHEFWRYYSPEENAVVVIPHIGRFSASGSFDAFVHALKPRLLVGELFRFGATPKDLGRTPTAETFDDLFSINVRDSVDFVADYKVDWKQVGEKGNK